MTYDYVLAPLQSSAYTNQLKGVNLWDYGTVGSATPTKQRSYTYLTQAPYLAAHILNRVLSDTTFYNGALAAQKVIAYDTTPLSTLSGSLAASVIGATNHDDANYNVSNNVRGNVTQTSELLSTGTLGITSTYYYNILGSKVRDVDANGNETVFDLTNKWADASCISNPSFAYPTSITKLVPGGVNQTTVTTYNSCDGLPHSLQDQNDLNRGSNGTVYFYGAVQNLINTAKPDGGATSLDYGGSAIPEVVTSTTLASPSGAVITSVTMDDWGRSAKVSSAGMTSDTTYDGSGQIFSKSNPHGPSSSVADGITYYYHDALGRLVATALADGSSRTSVYSGLLVDSYDEAGKHWKRRYDAFDRLTQVLEPDTSNNPQLETDYTYDGLDNVISIVQRGVVGREAPLVHTFNFDKLSRLITAVRPETGMVCYGVWSGASVGSGTCQNGYDANGNLLAQTDARGIVTTYSYDALNRLKYKRYSDGTKTAAFGYDGNTEDGTPLTHFGLQSSNAIGHLSLISNEVNAAETYSFDSMGRITLQNQFMPSVGNWGTTFSAQYDLAGNMLRLLYPDGRIVSQTFDSAGRLNSVSYAAQTTPNGDINGGTAVNTPYISSITYLPSGSPQRIVYGNGVTENLTQNNRLQPCESNAFLPPSAGGAMTMDHQYFYGVAVGAPCGSAAGNNGNLLHIVDNTNVAQGSTQHSQDFQYESLNRITDWQTSLMAGKARHQSFAYDSFGNLNQTNNLPPANTSDPLTFPAPYNPSAWPYDANNRLRANTFNCLPVGVTGTPGSVNTYDAAGNVLCSGTQGSDAKAYVWDAENRISQTWAAQNSSTNFTASYLYGAGGSRVRADQMVPGTTTTQSFREYVYMGGQVLTEKDQTGTWTDFIYAGGKKIAQAKNLDTAIHLHGLNCSNCGTPASAWNLTFGNYTIKPGDKVSWRQYQGGVARGGFTLRFTDGTYTNWGTRDTDGEVMNNDSIQGRWHQRTVDLSPLSGKTCDVSFIGSEVTAGPGVWDEWFADMALYSADGSVISIYNRGATFSAGYFGGAGVSNLSGVVDSSTVPPSATPNGATFFLSDQLGTAQMEFATGGWPIWKGEYAPFGQEIDTQSTANRYKFTGKERDTESGLDYFGARYYASTMGRFMSPDWASEPAAVPYSSLDNPQTLNLYGYVNNNPLSQADPDGHCCWDKAKQWVIEHPRSAQAVGGVGKVAVGAGLVGTIAIGDVPGSVVGVGLVVSGTIAAVSNVVSGVLDVTGAATNTDVEGAQKGLDSVSNVPALVTTAATGNPNAGAAIGTLADAAQLAAKPQEALKNAATMADAVKTAASAADLVNSWASAMQASRPPNPPPPPSPKCSVVGACR